MSKQNNMLVSAVEAFNKNALLINDLVENDIRTISLTEFESRLLPVIKEWAVDKVSDNILLWYMYAGSFNKKVKVIDNGTVVFYVPPPFTDILLPKDRESMRNVQKIDSLNKLITMKERDGETKEAIALSEQVNLMLTTTPDKDQQAKHVIMLAKIWSYLGLPVDQILAGAKVNLEHYNEHGVFIKKYAEDAAETVSKGTPNDGPEEDEFSF